MKIKKTMSLLMIILLLVSVMSVGSSPVAVAYEQFSENLSFAGGDGSAEDPYQIANWTHLDTVRNDLHANYTLIADIDDTTEGYETYVNTANGWEPIGNFSERFSGSFDGQGYVVNDLWINRPSTDYVGLFGYSDTGTHIYDLGLKEVDVDGHDYVGGLVGYNNIGTVNHSYVTGEVSGRWYVGGISGEDYQSAVNNSYASCTVDGVRDVGGLVGYCFQGSVKNSYATGDVSGDEDIGGLVGSNAGTVSNSYATGNVSGLQYVGGLVGYNSKVINSYATGNVSGDSDVGGLTGYTGWGYTVENSFWDMNTTGQTSSSGGTGKNTTAMKSVDTFTNTTTPGLDTPWDFINNPHQDKNSSDIWDIDNDQRINDGYPYFTWRDTSVLTIDSKGNGVVKTPGEGTFKCLSRDVVELEAIADENHHFVEWTGDNGTIGDTTSNKTTITVENDSSISATFEIDEHDLTVDSSENGKVTDPGEGTYTYDHGTEVDIAIKADTGYHFVKWTGDNGTIGDTTSNETTIIVESDCSITAEFAIDIYELIVSSSEGGYVFTPDEGTYTHEYGTVVDLVAVADDNYHFVEWTGDNVTVEDVNSETTSITVEDDYSISATFEIDEHDLTVDSPENGEVTAPGEGTYTYEYGTVIDIEATADEGYHFLEWSGDTEKIEDTTDGATTIEMLGDYEITAEFEEDVVKVTTYELVVEVDGNGSVDIDPDQSEYEEGTNVTLTATADEGWGFSEWTGYLTGTENEIVVTMEQNITITAVFQETVEDTDGDGVPDDQDDFPNDPNEATDTDGDGVGDNSDDFPEDPAASVDTDDDGKPDEWNDGCTADDSTTGLTLDDDPTTPAGGDGDSDEDEDDNMMLYLGIILLIVIIAVIAMKSKGQEEVGEAEELDELEETGESDEEMFDEDEAFEEELEEDKFFQEE